MITRAAGGAPIAVVVVLGLVGIGVGLLTGQRLARAGYRLDDEAGRLPRWTWWPAPAVGLLWAFLGWRIGDLADWAALPAYLLFGWIAVSLVWIDLDVHRLPDGLVLPAYPALIVLLGIATVASGEWHRGLWALGAMAALYLLFLLMALISPDSIGFGDVKVVGLIGLVMGWLGPGFAVAALLIGFIVGGVIALVLLALRQVGLKGHIAYGPALLVGAVVALALDLHLVPIA